MAAYSSQFLQTSSSTAVPNKENFCASRCCHVPLHPTTAFVTDHLTVAILASLTLVPIKPASPASHSVPLAAQ